MRRFLSAEVAGSLLLAAGGAAADGFAVVTSVEGQASASGRSVSGLGDVQQREPLEVDPQGACSVLLGRAAIAELCGGSRVSFERDASRGVQLVRLDAGRLRLVVEEQAPGERIEIHTPAAIATILGTVVYVEVDEATGSSTFSSAEHRIAIQDRSRPSERPITIEALEQLRVAPGEASEKMKLEPGALDALGACLPDFHELAVREARGQMESAALERGAELDGVAFERALRAGAPDGAALERTLSADEPDGGDDLAQDGIVDVTDTEVFRDLFEASIDSPPGCDIPGEHCGFGASD